MATQMKGAAAPATDQKVEQTKVDKYKAQFAELRKKYPTWSGLFRFLKSEGLSTGEIAKVCDKRYQHVRNVLITPVSNKNSSAPANANASKAG